MRSTFVRRSSVAARVSVLTALAGVAASANAALFTFVPACASPSWTGFCNTVTPCAGGNFITVNNWGNSACGVSPALPPGGSDIVIAGNGALDAGSGMNTIVINPGVIAVQAASISTTAGFTNNGNLSTNGGDKIYAGLIANNGTWAEDGAGWTRPLNSCTFTNTGSFQLPGTVALSQNSGTNTFSNVTTGTVTKSSGGTATFTGFNFVNSGAIGAAAGGGALNFSNMAFVSQTGATYSASAGGSINFGGGSIRGPFPMTLGADNLMSFSNVTLGAPTTLSATGGTALLSGNITGSATNTLTNTGLVRINGGDGSWAGAFTNNSGATWTEDGAGWTRALNTNTFTNAGTLNFPGTVAWSQNSGVNTFTNTGSVVKSSGGTMQMTGYARTNSGAMNVVANGGTLQFNSSSFASNAGATYNVTGPSSSIFWNGNTISGNFPIALSAGGGASFTSLTTSAPTTINASGGSAVINAGSMNTTGGLLTNAGQLAIGGGDHSWTGPWTNAASGTVTEDAAGWTRAFNSCAVTNNGTINFPGSVNWNHNSGVNTVLNTGTMNKTSGGQFTINNVASFTNNGTVAVANAGGNFVVTSATYSGTGNVTVQTGGNFQLNSCTVTGPVNGTNTGGTFQSTGSMTVPASTTTQLNVTGSGFTVNSNLAINTTSGLLRNNNVANVTAGDKTFSGDITNSVGATWTEDGSGWTRVLNSNDFLNQGTLNLPGGLNWNQNSGTNTLTNTGTINKTSGGTFTANNITSVTNNGTIAIASGGGTFQATSTAYSGTGTATVVSGGLMRLNSCTITGPINGVTSGTGGFDSIGTLTVGTGGASLNVTGNGFTLNGSKAGTPMLTNNAIVSVTAGDKTFTGPVTNASGASWTEDGSGWTRVLNSFIFTNSGTLNLPGGINWNHNSGVNRLDNLAGGVVNKTSGGSFNASASVGVVNAGLIDIQSGTFNASGGLTQTASTGRTLVRSGAVLTGTPFTLAGGRLEGKGTINQVVTNAGGTVAPGDAANDNGNLTFANTYTQQSGGTYEVSLFGRPANPYDRITTNNQLTLGGTLRVVITPPFLPKLNDVYEIARSNSNQRVGTFASVVVVGPPAVTVNVTYTASSVFLTITQTECGSIDFNNDTSFFDPQDIDAFLSVYAEGPCIPASATCNDIDFNNDTSIFDPCDIDSFLTVFSEGPCTLCGV
ncbi:MAG: hypothetical protein U0640_02475 [Phycisphaerales bacterium]